MTRQTLETQLKAHGGKILFAIAAASITVITQTGDAIATRVSDMIFTQSAQSANIASVIESCKIKEAESKYRDSLILVSHHSDIAIFSEALQSIKESNAKLESKIDMQSAKLDGMLEGIKLRNSLSQNIGYAEMKNDSTKPCNVSYAN